MWPSLSWAADRFRQQGGELMYDVIIAAAIQQQEQPTQHQTAERSHVWEQLAACLRRVM